jgi:Domain of unknown function (DUF4864)
MVAFSRQGVAMRHLSLGFRSLLIACATFAALVVTPPAAAAVTPEDAQSIQKVVQAQLAAFAADDAKLAFSFAAPNIRTLFETPENFLAMVRKGYPVVYRPASVLFLTPKALDAEIVQPVHMRDSQGSAWIVMYTLRRQADTSWRISSCVLVENKTQAV